MRRAIRSWMIPWTLRSDHAGPRPPPCVGCGTVTENEDEHEDPDEIRVDDIVVDIANFEVRLPDGEYSSINSDIAQGLIPEDSVKSLPLATVAEALGLLSNHVDAGAPEGWLLETDPPNRLYEIELHEGLALQSHD